MKLTSLPDAILAISTAGWLIRSRRLDRTISPMTSSSAPPTAPASEPFRFTGAARLHARRFNKHPLASALRLLSADQRITHPDGGIALLTEAGHVIRATALFAATYWFEQMPEGITRGFGAELFPRMVLGTIVGVVDRPKLLDGSKIRPGDAIIGLRGNGLHTNGYSLARKVLLDRHETLGTLIHEHSHGWGGDGSLDHSQKIEEMWVSVARKMM